MTDHARSQIVTPKSCLFPDSVVCIIVTTWLPNPRWLNLLISTLKVKVQGKGLSENRSAFGPLFAEARMRHLDFV
jgi:hypothetical protein